MRRHRTARAVAGALAGSLLLLPLTGCSDASLDEDATPSVSASLPSTIPSAEASVDAGNTTVDAECSGTSCEVTLGSGQEAEVLGTTISFTSSEGGVATLQAGGREVTCEEGEDVSAGPVTLTCSALTGDSVTLTASLG